MSAFRSSWLPAQAAAKYSLVTRLLLWAGVVGPPLFVVVLLIEGATRPGYSAWRTFASLLSLGDLGWIQIANFIVCGVLALCFAIGLRQVLHTGKGATWGPILLGLWGLLLIIAGIFVTDPGQGYPVGVAPPVPPTGHGIIHSLAGLAIFIVLPINAFVMSRRFVSDPTWRGWTLITGLILVVSVFFAQLPGDHAVAGLLQRVGIIAGWLWVSLFAIALLRKGRG